MKKILLFIACLALSINAMEIAPQIADYDAAKHESAVTTIFFESFPDAQEAPEEITNPAACPHASIAVLEYDNKPAGFAMWERENVSFNKAFADIPGYKNTKKSLNVFRLNYLAIDKSKRGKKFGKTLLEYVKNKAQHDNFDIISLNAADGSAQFYAKQGYLKTNGNDNIDLMSFPLNEDVKDILNAVKAARIKNIKNGKGLRLHRDLI